MCSWSVLLPMITPTSGELRVISGARSEKREARSGYSLLQLGMLLVPIRRLLVRVRHRQDGVVGEEATDDCRAHRLRVGAVGHAIRKDDGRVAGLVRQADIAAASEIHVEVLHQRRHLMDEDVAASLDRKSVV